jgi:hypothetical protein
LSDPFKLEEEFYPSMFLIATRFAGPASGRLFLKISGAAKVPAENFIPTV